MTTSIFYERVKEQAVLRHQSLNQVERNLGYSRNALNNSKHATSPSANRLLELAKYFQVPPEYLIGIDQRGKRSPIKYFYSLTEAEKKQLCILSQEWLSGFYQKAHLN